MLAVTEKISTPTTECSGLNTVFNTNVTRSDTHSAKKTWKRGSFCLVCFRKCSKKFLVKARTRNRDRWVHSKASKICTKMWYIRDKVCGLTKKKEKKLATVIAGLSSLEKRRLKKCVTERIGHFSFHEKRQLKTSYN